MKMKFGNRNHHILKRAEVYTSIWQKVNEPMAPTVFSTGPCVQHNATYTYTRIAYVLCAERPPQTPHVRPITITATAY